MLLRYAGIGSRQTPLVVCEQMTIVARVLASKHRAILRSGRAPGADLAFEIGAAAVGGARELFTLRDVDGNPHWLPHAKQYHRNWHRLDKTAQGLHARNSAIMLGATLNEPVDFVACWTQNGLFKGGTAQALRIAIDLKIPVFNFWAVPTVDAFAEWFLSKGFKNVA